MKNTFLLLLASMTLSCANAQKTNGDEAPQIVKDAFAKKYPSAKVEKWEKEGNDYEAEFILNKVESSAVFDSKGNFKEVEQEISTKDLPKSVTEYCTNNFSSYKLTEAAKITDADGKIMYEAEMTKGKEHFDAIFDSEGNFVKKSEPVSSEEDED